MKTLKSLIIGLISAAILATAPPARADLQLPQMTPVATEMDVTIGFEVGSEVYYLSESPEENDNISNEVVIVPSAQITGRSRWVLNWYHDPTATQPLFVVISNKGTGHFLKTGADGNGELVGETTFVGANITILRWFLVPRSDGRVSLFHRSNQKLLARRAEDPLRTEGISPPSPIPDRADWRLNLQPPSADSDGDGITDDQDAFPHSILTPTVIIGGQDTGVPNTRFSDGSTLSDQIAQRAASAKNHGQFVSAVAELTNWLKSQGIITGAQKGAIDSAAAKSSKP